MRVGRMLPVRTSLTWGRCDRVCGHSHRLHRRRHCQVHSATRAWIAAGSSASGAGGRPAVAPRAAERRPGAAARRPMLKRPRSPAVPWPRAHAQGQLFGGGDALHCLAQGLVFECLLTQEALQLADLLLRGAVLGRRHDLLPSAGRRECALGHQPAPGEGLVGADAVAATDDRDGIAGQVRLFDDAHTFSSVDQRRRRWTDVITSTRSARGGSP